ncbi:glycerol-3-phosphate dehydrogenase [NAD(P)+] [Anaerocolumna cellulosilytica]|uniref:Glycerol-3-phosphate dehydrogenase [NAD(P)+] n=1 Tax=Anaerocolumna cellulosilytica TaxID=433286 RepID=A0A6S6QWS6_9FIRM|nr:NAD(P)H-dependent glycerol-3-phosphate dehydrogenase [Anaerocolumna cellulosilytica]MBB5198056.1 glycerol-3-phosphate dehydrogenase (NAD(P)+) [Anaerocolumna cellulosilytica]BCJ95074.1 glycerol-3-phosphate dehydrogenase [NAD(P)+] [Anaerocolumna cellulosilytica]
MAKVSILGAGAWGTAIAILLGNNGHEVTLWSALESEVKLLNEERELKDKLPGAKLPESVAVCGELEEACRDKELLVFAVASPFVRNTAKIARPFIKENQIVVNVAKGIEESTLNTLTDILKEELNHADIAVLSGPSHAEEVSRGIPTTCVVGAETKASAYFIQDVFMSERFRVYTSPDVVGIELGGSIKNVIALAAGIADGLGFGDNTKAALMTRGIAEISRLGLAMGGKMETFAGLSGVGDLIVTCTSKHSRNRNAGFLIGQGYTMEKAMEEVNQVVEGVFSAKATLALAKKYNVEMPIVEQVNLVLFENKSAKEAVSDLLLRDKRREYSELTWLE